MADTLSKSIHEASAGTNLKYKTEVAPVLLRNADIGLFIKTAPLAKM